MLKLGEPGGQTRPVQSVDELRIGRSWSRQCKVGAQGGCEQVRLVVKDGEHLPSLAEIEREGILVAQEIAAPGGVELSGQYRQQG